MIVSLSRRSQMALREWHAHAKITQERKILEYEQKRNEEQWRREVYVGLTASVASETLELGFLIYLVATCCPQGGGVVPPLSPEVRL